jgi:hypothetical protein
VAGKQRLETPVQNAREAVGFVEKLLFEDFGAAREREAAVFVGSVERQNQWCHGLMENARSIA